MGNQIKWGAVLSYVNIIIQIIVGLVYTPIMLRLLGQEEYGLYSLIGSIVAYLSILDLGLGNTMTRYTAKNRADGNKNKEAELNGLFLTVYTVIGIITLIIGTILYYNIENIFDATLSSEQIERAKIMMIMLVINISATFPLSVFGSIMQAYERFIFIRVVNIVSRLTTPLVILPLLMYGYGSVAMVSVNVVCNMICLLVNVIYCYKYLNINFKWGAYEKTYIYEIAIFSFFIFLNVIMDKVYWGTGQVVLGIVSGPAQVAVYAIAMQFMMMYMQFSGAISGVFLPKVTMMVANNVPTIELTNLMIKVGRLQMYVVGFILIMFVFLGEDFIFLWAGENYIDAYPIVLVLMMALTIALVQNVGTSILLAMNKNRYRMTIYSIFACITFVLCFPTAKYFGGIGCAFCTAVSLIISTGYFMNKYYKDDIGLDIKLFWKNILQILSVILLISIVYIGIEYFINLDISWYCFTIKSIIFSSIYIVIVYRLAMNEYECNLIKSFVNKYI